MNKASEIWAEALPYIKENVSDVGFKTAFEKQKQSDCLVCLLACQYSSSSKLISFPKLFSSERTDWTKQQLEHLSQLNVLEKQLQDTQTKNDCESEHWELPNLNAVIQ